MSTATQDRPAAVLSGGHPRQAMFDELAARITTAPGEHDHIEVENSATGEKLGAVPKCGPEDLDLAVERARAVQQRWRETDFSERRRILLRFHDLILARQDEVLDILHQGGIVHVGMVTDRGDRTGRADRGGRRRP